MAGRMTRREQMAKDQIYEILGKQGYPTYASLFNLFDLFLTKDPSVAAYMIPSQAKIVINDGLDIAQVSTIVRHEILHEYLTHEMRLLKHLAEKHGLKYDELTQNSLDDLKNELYSNDIFNIAADYEISNRGYTEADKSIVRGLKIGEQVVRGLVTEDDHEDWVDLPVEDMYDKLVAEQKKDQQKNKQNQNGDDQDGQGGGKGQDKQYSDDYVAGWKKAIEDIKSGKVKF